ncbi:hypothetical protein GCM10027053_52820 [Intrasporangium mesophilum]
MSITTMTMSAASCVLSVRPRAAGQIRLADTHALGQGTTVSIAAREGRMSGVTVPVQGDISVAAALTFDPNYKPSDVARSRSGRPPV